MSYYKVRVKRYTTRVQTYEVSVNTNCPLHAKEMAAEVLEDQLNGIEHELECGDPEPVWDNEIIDEDFKVSEAPSSEPVLCENTEDCFIN